jgi:hypothetical protein
LPAWDHTGKWFFQKALQAEKQQICSNRVSMEEIFSTSAAAALPISLFRAWRKSIFLYFGTKGGSEA